MRKGRDRVMRCEGPSGVARRTRDDDAPLRSVVVVPSPRTAHNSLLFFSLRLGRVIAIVRIAAQTNFLDCDSV